MPCKLCFVTLSRSLLSTFLSEFLSLYFIHLPSYIPSFNLLSSLPVFRSLPSAVLVRLSKEKSSRAANCDGIVFDSGKARL